MLIKKNYLGSASPRRRDYAGLFGFFMTLKDKRPYS